MRTPATSSQWWELGVTACGLTQGSWTGYVGKITKDYSAPAALITAISPNGGKDIGSAGFDPGTAWHTYRLEVRGNKLTFFIDGAPVVQATDDEFITCGQQVGFYDGGGVQRTVQVSSFKVIAL
jgi:hypothetical protein